MSLINKSFVCLTGLALSLAACGFVPASPSVVTADNGPQIDCDAPGNLCGPQMPPSPAPPPPPPPPPASAAISI